MDPFKSFVRIFSVSLVLFLVTAGASFGFAQATGSIQGSAVDSTGASAPGVTVTISNVGMGVQRTVKTNDSGIYVVSALPPAEYDVTAELTGFAKIAKHVTLSAGGQLTVDLALAVGEV